MKTRALAAVIIGVQVVGMVVLGLWWLLGRGTDEPLEALAALQVKVQREGPAAAFGSLPDAVVEAGRDACVRDACIAARYEGDRGRWAAAVAARRADPCARFEHAACSASNVRTALLDVLRRLPSCEVEGTSSRRGERRLRVRCEGRTDFISFQRAGLGWSLAGEPQFPGLLPNLYYGDYLGRNPRAPPNLTR